MFFSLAILLTMSLLSAKADFIEDSAELNEHIIGGMDADIRDHPYLVSIRFAGHHYCAGSIYRNNVIITAAHCVYGKVKAKLEVFAGSTFLSNQNQRSQVLKVKIHPGYKHGSFDYDIAIVWLTTSLVYNDKVRPIELVKSRPEDETKVTVVGWGYKREHSKNSERLQEVSVNIVSNEECTYPITKRMICAGIRLGGKDACQNDSGGPLTYGNKLLGLVSFGYGCGRVGYPGVYTSIPVFYEWIISTAT